MTLRRVVIQGFKSFADRTEFQFDHPLVAVVGPNGSGKSNIADAVRWVLGEQSSKLLRIKQSSELIFGGSATLSRASFATVELHFDNTDKRFPVDYSEVVISRTVYGDGESEYQLNQASVRLQDILLMLAQARFGQKSYAVIGQGMITNLLNSTPTERKLVFDEATGVREYQIQRDQSINRLVRTEQHLQQAQTVITELEPRVDALRRQVKRLHQRAELETELRDLQVRYYGSVWAGLTTTANQTQAQRLAVETQLAEHEAVVTDLQAQVDAQATLQSLPQQYDDLQQQLNAQLERRNQLTRDQAVLKAKLEVEQHKQGSLTLAWLNRQVDQLTAQQQQMKQQLAGLQEQQQRHSATRDRLQLQHQAMEEDCLQRQQAVSDAQAKVEQAAHNLSLPEVRTHLEVIFEDHKQLLTQLLATNTMEQFRQLQQQAKTTMKKFAQFMDQLITVPEPVLDSVRQEVLDAQHQLQQAISERQALVDGINQAQVGLAATTAQVDVLQAQLQRLTDERAVAVAELATATAAESATPTEAAQAALQSIENFEQQIATVEQTMNSIRDQLDQFHRTAEDQKTKLVQLQTQLRTAQRSVATVRQELHAIAVQEARIETRQADVRATIEREVAQDVQSTIWSASTRITDVDETEAQRRMIATARKLASLGTIDPAVEEEYRQAQDRFDFFSHQLSDASKTIDALEQVIDELDTTIHKQFQKNFRRINEEFARYFQVLFGGGHARLQLLTEEPATAQETDLDNATTPTPSPDDPTTLLEPHQSSVARWNIRQKQKFKIVSGIDIIVTLPTKTVHSTASLSGGEKSLVAIALLCAIMATNPAPFVILDEVEAALDEENSEKFAAILRQLAEHTTIIIITHNRVTMRAADMLYGVTTGPDGKSHILSVALSQA